MCLLKQWINGYPWGLGNNFEGLLFSRSELCLILANTALVFHCQLYLHSITLTVFVTDMQIFQQLNFVPDKTWLNIYHTHKLILLLNQFNSSGTSSIFCERSKFFSKKVQFWQQMLQYTPNKCFLICLIKGHFMKYQYCNKSKAFKAVNRPWIRFHCEI